MLVFCGEKIQHLVSFAQFSTSSGVIIFSVHRHVGEEARGENLPAVPEDGPAA